MNKTKKSRLSWRKYHRWVGLVLALFMIVFCVSGIILNHRSLVAGLDVNRSLLPSGYRINDYSGGVVKSTLRLGGDTVVAYGCGGVWLTDTAATHWQQLNEGFGQGVDRRNVRNVVRDNNGRLWCITNYSLYCRQANEWHPIALPTDGERLTDVALCADGSCLVALSRNAVYRIELGTGAKAATDGRAKVTRIALKAPKDYTPKETLFRTVWKLHSGELFGLPGQLVVDAIAVVLIILSVTGIVIFILPYSIKCNNRKGNRDGAKSKARAMGWNLRWHNRLGSVTIILTLLLTFTGTCLRPPFMIPLVMVKTAPFNSSDNPWHDKLRAIRWDKVEGQWLVSTSEGFLTVDKQFAGVPKLIKDGAPSVSPMGVNAFQQQSDGTWLIGSFSGMFSWNKQQGTVLQFPSGKPVAKAHGFSLASTAVSGYSADFLGGRPIIFGYSNGAAGQMPAMPDEMKSVPMSLWNVALELHVGRCYAPFLGPLSEMFVFLFGTLITLIVLSGYIIYRRTHRRRKPQQKQSKADTATAGSADNADVTAEAGNPERQ